MKINFCLAMCFLVLGTCSNDKSQGTVPGEFRKHLTHSTSPTKYQEIQPYHGGSKLPIPDSLSRSEVLADIDMYEYLITTAYSGYEYWMTKGVNFDLHIEGMRQFANENSRISSLEFEKELSKILLEIDDGHICFVGHGFNMAYHHKAVFFCDVVVEKSSDNQYVVIGSMNDKVRVGDRFTQTQPKQFLFRTLSSTDKQQYLIGVFTNDAISSKTLSFNDENRELRFHKNRLMFASFSDPTQFYVDRVEGIPLIRVTSFADALYPQMKEFMQAGNELKHEPKILVNLFNNGGGSSVFPQTFISNLNGPVQWETHWAELTSPAITEYYAKMDRSQDSDRSPSLIRLIDRYSKEFDRFRRDPIKHWGFSRTYKLEVPGEYDGQLILLTNRRVLSAGENMVGASRSLRNQIIIGENTGGSAQFSSTCGYYLPHSRIVLNLPRQLIFVPGLEECVGYLPDYWLDTKEPVEEVLKWVRDPDEYQFEYIQSYSEMLASLEMSAIPPEDSEIIPPGPDIPESLAQFSGRWFGVSDGILDHLLIVEKISSPAEIRAVYAWGVAYQWGINQPGWERFQGVFKDGKLVLKPADGVLTISYWINPDGSMGSVYERPGIYSRTELTNLE